MVAQRAGLINFSEHEPRVAEDKLNEPKEVQRFGRRSDVPSEDGSKPQRTAPPQPEQAERIE